MNPPAFRSSRGWFASSKIALLLAVGLALTVFHAGQPVHLHHGATAGFYNEEHVLAALDSVTSDAPLPADGPGIGLDLAPAKAQLPAGARLVTTVGRLADSRAPPLA